MTASLENQTRQALFVAWQDPHTKRYYPVGRLIAEGGGNGHAPVYEFCYLNGVSEAQKVGFTSFLAFPDLDRVYRSSELFPLFANRLMPRSRPDFDEYVARLDLSHESATDLEILARSGGRRVTDSLEVFPMPDLARHGCYVTYFLVHGIRYLSDHALARIEQLQVNEQLLIIADFQNSADSSAIALRTADRTIVGYLPRYLLPDIWQLLKSCPKIEVFVQLVNPPPAPLQQRLLCRMETCWPEDFRPYCTDEYQPRAADAIRFDCSDSLP